MIPLKATISLQEQSFSIDLSIPLDISIPLRDSNLNPTAWYLDKPAINPVQDGNWIGAVSKGGSVNFNNIHFNPHAHGTHTECVGHITQEFHAVNALFSTYFFTAALVSVQPKMENSDFIISKEILEEALGNSRPEALVIRTLPNSEDKLSKQYSHTNWPYLSQEAAQFLCSIGIQHLLIDTPSVDKEKDDGALLAHKAFWNLGENTRHRATITEFIYAPDTINDGSYVLELQLANMVNDAAPSRPILYKIKTS